MFKEMHSTTGESFPSPMIPPLGLKAKRLNYQKFIPWLPSLASGLS
jgi:hypothetical protein